MLVTVVIPTFNGAPRVGRLLELLGRQTLPPSDWNVLIVDNASTDGTGSIVLQSNAARHLLECGIQVRVIDEPTKGANYARIRGLETSTTDIVCFLDDDVDPDPELLSGGVRTLSDPNVALALPQISPLFTTPPPASVLRRKHLFAINYDFLGAQRIEWSGDSSPFAPIVTAGLLVRRGNLLRAIEQYGRARMLPGRTGKALACGEDIELGILARRAGYKCVFEPSLKLRHHIEPDRLKSWYVARLIIGITRSQLTLEEIHGRTQPHRRWLRALGAWLELGRAILALPVLLGRADGLREAIFTFSARWARVRGPYQELLLRASNGSTARNRKVLKPHV